MKKILLFLTILSTLSSFSFSQNRELARGTESGELYLAYGWYGIFHPIYPGYDTLRTAVYRITENGKKITIQYDADFFADLTTIAMPGIIFADATPGAIYIKNYFTKDSYFHTSLWLSFDYGKNWIFRGENKGNIGFFGTGAVEGTIYKGGANREALRSKNHGESFEFDFFVPLPYVTGIAANKECEFFGLGKNSQQYELHYTDDCADSFRVFPIGAEFIYGPKSLGDPDVFPGGTYR